MSLGFGHLVGAWLPAKAIEWYRKKPFSQPVLALLLLGAILPDADFLLEWAQLIPDLHRTITHSVVGVVLAGAMMYLASLVLRTYVDKKLNPLHLSLALSIGMCTHLFYDSLIYPGINLLWPSNIWFASGMVYAAKQTLYERVGHLSSQNKTHLFILDMGLGVAWMAYFWCKGRLKL